MALPDSYTLKPNAVPAYFDAILDAPSNTVLITGGASGIGYELTKQLTALGNTILVTGRDQAKMDRAKAAFPKIHTFRSDVSDPKAIATLYESVMI